MADIHARGIEELIFGGDIGERSANADVFASLASFGLRLRVVLGNHDTAKEVQKYFCRPDATTNGTELYYAEEDGGFRYLFLDSSAGVIGGEQYDWLAQQLKTDKPLVVFLHHPIVEVVSSADRLYPLKERERIKALFLQHTKHVTVFCGHYHFEDHQTDGNITQFVTPAASFQLKKESAEFETMPGPFGYRIIKVCLQTVYQSQNMTQAR